MNAAHSAGWANGFDNYLFIEGCIARKTGARLLQKAASIMRQVLVDHARARGAAKRGGKARTLALDETLDAVPANSPSVIAIDDALRSLAAIDEGKARLVELRFFGGLTSLALNQVRQHQLKIAQPIQIWRDASW